MMNALTLCFLIYSATGANAVFTDQPRLQTVDGHLFIYGGQDKNLTFMTTNKGYVNVNGENLFGIVQNAKIATALIKNLKYTALNKLEDDMKSIALNLEQLSQRLNACESALTSFKSKDKGYFPAVTLLRSRVVKLERRVRRISMNLLRNECRRDPCLNGGTCFDRYLGYECRCPDGWEGKKCEKDVNECAKFAGTDLGCQNGATCVNTKGSYECHCAPGWHGLHCLRRSNDCSSGSAAELCGHGICVSQANDPRGYTCICSQGWKTDGVSLACTIDVDECSTSPCSRNPPVSCHNAPGTFFCGPCPPGYTGNGFQCTDVDECSVDNGGCSVRPMVPCINTVGSSTCGSCPPGYSGDGRTCTFIGKCQVDNGGCHAKALCTEIGSNVQCRCLPGYTGYGIGPFGCQELSGPISGNPCQSNPCKFGGRCYAVSDSEFTCACMAGYSGTTCEIANACDSNPCVNGGTCESSGDTFRCRCRTQFSGRFCEDQIEECGGHLKGEGGLVKFPLSNSSNIDFGNCVWVIEVDIARVINITFRRFELRTSFECQLEWLEIHDGGSVGGVTIGRYCGGNRPPTSGIVTTQSHARVMLVTTERGKSSGFEFAWSAADPVCGGAVNASVHGVITSPGYPGNYPNNRNCYWEVLAPVGKRIMFTVFELRLRSTGSCSADFLEIHEDLSLDSPLLGKFCNTSSPEILETPGNMAYVFFHSDAKDSDKGFQIAYHPKPGHPGCGGIYTSLRGEIVPPTRNDYYLPNMDCVWIIRLPEERRIKVDFAKFSVQNSRNCRDDFLELRDGGDVTSPLLGKYCGSVLPPSVSSNQRTMFVRFYSDEVIERAGFQIHYQSVCDVTLTDASGVIKSPGYPGTYKSEEECVFVIEQPVGKIINLEFQEFEIESTYRCIFDYVEVRDGHDAASPLIGRYCGSNRPGRIVSTHNYLYLKMVTDNNVELAGFYGNYSTVDVSCGGIHTATTGTVTSPVIEGRYPSNSYCRWVIAVQQGHLIQLTFTKFKVEGFKDCTFDYVAVYDNSTALRGANNLIGRYCNYDLPPVLTSSSNVLTVVFKSDSSFNDEGFQIAYTSINGSSTCGGKFFTEWGVIKSPNYPNPYPNGITCSWVIHVKNGHRISLNVTDFVLEIPFVLGNKKCKFDYLEIRDGGYVSSPLIGRFCGTDIPRQILSQSNNLYLEFGSDNLDSGKGFQIYWDGSIKGCGGTLTGPTGSIISPNYPESYGSIVNCVYHISISHGSKIQISFVDLELEAAANCKKESIEIFDGIDFQSRSLGKFCTFFNVPPSILSSGNHLTIRFKSGVRAAGKGYFLKYFTACRTNVTGYRGVIESPNFPGNFPSSLDCLWSIKAPLGNKITLKFTDFNFRASCRNTYLEIFEGNPKFGDTENVKKYCKNNKTLTAESSGEWLHIHFVTSDRPVVGNFRLEWAVKGCGGYLTKPTGTFTSPNYPNLYRTNTHCEWWITVDPTKSITLSISDFNFEKTVDCDFDGLEVYGGPDKTSPLLTKICSTRKEDVVVTSAGNRMYVFFQSDVNNVGRGFKATYRTSPSSCGGLFTAPTGSIHSRNYPKNYQMDNCEWHINVEQNHRVSLKFVSFDVTDSENCSGAYVEVFDGPNIASRSLLRHCGNKLPALEAILSTGNSMTILMNVLNATYTAKGFLANYETVCGGEVNADVDGVLEGGFHGGSHLASGMCTWVISTSRSDGHVILTLSHLSLGEADPTCSMDRLVVYDGADNSTQLGTYCSSSSPLPIVSHGNQLLLDYIGGWSSSSFFQAMYTSASSACGGDLSSENGLFASPNYPDSYPPDSECIWTVKSAPGNRVELSFKVFDIGSADFCNDEYLEVRNGDGQGRLQGVYCGSDMPANLTAENSLWIKFKSKSGGTGSMRFLATYSLVYGNEINGTSGEIASPGYPRYYSGSNPVSWRIMVAFKAFILVQIKDFFADAGDVDDCSRSLTIYDGFDDTAPVLVLKCGADLSASPITSSSNVVYIVLSACNYNLGCKFSLEWVETKAKTAAPITPTSSPVPGCGGEFYLSTAGNSSVTINLPGVSPPMAEKCVWKVSCAEEEHLAITAKEIVMKYLMNCESAYIQISTNFEGNWKELARICEAKELNATVHGRNVITITYYDAWAATESPGTFVVRTECGGSIRKTNGVIDFEYTKYPSIVASQNSIPVPKYLCQWDIAVTVGRTIKTTLLEFDGLNAENGVCVKNYFTLRNGGSEDSPYLGAGVYCSTTDFVPTTTSNKMFIKVLARYPFYGFSLMFEEVPHECGDEITLSDEMNSTVISSPNYPNVPPIKVECVWTFFAAGVRRLRMDFLERFDLAQSYGCTVEYVSVRDGGTDLADEIGHFCSEKPNSVKSTGNMLYVKYYTNATDPQNGFKARVSLDRCGGIITSSSGIITSPGYPNKYPFHTQCRWQIESNSRSTLKISFLDVDLPHNFTSIDTGPSFLTHVLPGDSQSGLPGTVQLNNTACSSSARITVSDIPVVPVDFSSPSLFYELKHSFKTDTVLGVVCSTGTNKTIETSGNKAVIEFDSGPWDVGHYFATPRGFKIKFSSDTRGCWHKLYAESGTIETPEKPVLGYYNCQWMISVPRGRRISVIITEPAIPILFFNWDVLLLAYNDHSYRSRIGSLLPKVGSPYEPVKSSAHYMTIDFVAPYTAQTRFKLTYNSDEPAVCGGNVTDSSGVLESPKNITSYYCPWYFTSTSRENKTLSVTVYDSVIGNRTGTCTTEFGNYLSLSTTERRRVNLPGGLHDHIVVLCGNVKFRTIRTPFIDSVLTAVKGLPFSGDMNFKVKYKISTCGGVLTGSEFVITSPGYPENYPNDIDCAWVVTVPLGAAVKLTFEDIEFDVKSGCKDYLTVKNGPNTDSPTIDMFCGILVESKPIISETSHVLLEFHSDESNSARGFKIKVEAVNSACGGFVHSQSTEITSPHFPKPYGNNEECEWEIRSTAGTHIGLVFRERFHIEDSSDCHKDFLQVFDYVENEWKLLKKICGREFPAPINSTTNRMKIIFRSDDKVTSDGFKARWYENCGATYTNVKRGRIVSPGYPGKYLSDLHCEYFIKYSNMDIDFNFTSFNLESGNQGLCTYDSVELFRFDWRNEYMSEGKYCGSSMPPPKSVFERAKIVFNTDTYSNYNGFELNFFVHVCGGVIKEPTEIRVNLSRINYVRQYHCRWRIIAPEDKIVVLRFISLQLPVHSSCGDFALKVTETDSLGSQTLLATICGTIYDNLPVIRSNFNNVTLELTDISYALGHGFSTIVSFSYGRNRGCGGTVSVNSNPETVQSPDVNRDDAYEEMMDCTWVVLAKPYHYIIANFLRVDVDNCNSTESVGARGSCSCDFVELRNGIDATGDVLETVCGNRLPAAVVSSRNSMTLRFVSDASINRKGFAVQFSSALSECGEGFFNVTRGIRTLSSPHYPEKYPLGIRCQWVLADAVAKSAEAERIINIHVVEWDLEDGDSLTFRATVGSGGGMSGGDNQTILVVGKKVYYGFSNSLFMNDRTLTGKGKRLDYYVKSNEVTIDFVSKGSATKKGFKLEYSIAGCSRNYSTEYGQIVPFYQSGGLSCNIVIEAPTRNHTISLYFNSVDLYDENFTCVGAYVEVLDGSSSDSPLIRKFCGHQRPSPLYSSGQYLRLNVHYKARNNVFMATELFDLTFTTTDKGKGCGGRVASMAGIISSPGYPANFRRKTECRWDIAVPQGLELILKFINFDVGPANTCDTDFVRISDVASDGSENVRTTFCGGSNPAVIRSQSNVAVVYETSVHNGGTGWEMEYKAVVPGARIMF